MTTRTMTRDDDAILEAAETPSEEMALDLRHPATPLTVTDLAALKGQAIEIVDTREQVMATLRRASIRLTSPEDWVLFKAPDHQGGQIVGYLQDAGCQRVRDIWGIRIYDVSTPEKVMGADPSVFHYLVSGNGHSNLTQQTVEAIEGGRSSNEDFCKGKTGVDLELAVRKAARANLNGNITRELGGLKSVPLDELRAAWVGTSKRPEQCRLGRGFGSTTERLGGRSEKAPDVDPPKCGVCGTVAVYRPGKDGRGAFYGCPQYQSHTDRKWTVDAAKWIAQQQAKTTSATPESAADRQPGEEG